MRLYIRKVPVTDGKMPPQFQGCVVKAVATDKDAALHWAVPSSGRADDVKVCAFVENGDKPGTKLHRVLRKIGIPSKTELDSAYFEADGRKMYSNERETISLALELRAGVCEPYTNAPPKVGRKGIAIGFVGALAWVARPPEGEWLALELDDDTPWSKLIEALHATWSFAESPGDHLAGRPPLIAGAVTGDEVEAAYEKLGEALRVLLRAGVPVTVGNHFSQKMLSQRVSVMFDALDVYGTPPLREVFALAPADNEHTFPGANAPEVSHD